MLNSLCQTNHISEPNDNIITVITLCGFYCNFGDYWLILLMKADQAILNHKLKQKKTLEFQPKIKQQFKAKINWQTIQKKK